MLSSRVSQGSAPYPLFFFFNGNLSNMIIERIRVAFLAGKKSFLLISCKGGAAFLWWPLFPVT